MTFIEAGEIVNNLNAIAKSGGTTRSIIEKLVDAAEEWTDVQTKQYLSSAKVNASIVKEVLARKAQKQRLVEATAVTKGATVATGALGATENVTTVSTNLFTVATTKAKAAVTSFGMAIKAHPIIAAVAVIGAAIGALVMSYNKHKEAQEEARQKAEESAKSLKEETQSIDDYSKKYKDLHDALIAANGDEKRTYEIKQELLSLQEELNEKYGDEYGKLNLVTGAYNDQAEAIKNYALQVGKNYLNDNYDQIKKAEEEMEEVSSHVLGFPVSSTSASGKAIRKIANKYEDQGFINKDLNDDTYWIYVNANTDEAYDSINSFMTDVSKLKQKYGEDDADLNGVIETTNKSLSTVVEIYRNWNEIYQQALTYKIKTDYGRKDNVLSQGYDDAVESVKAYNDAILHSASPVNDSKVLEAYNNLEKAKSNIDKNSEAWEKYRSVVDNVFDHADTRLVEFVQKIRNDEWSIGELTKYINGQDFSETEITALANSGEAGIPFDALAAKAKYYGISVNELISLLTQLNIVHKDVADSAEESGSSELEMIKAITGMSEGFEEFDKIYSSIKGKDPFNFSLLDDKKFTETFENLDGFEEFITAVTTSPKDIEACQPAFDNLLSSWLDYTGILDNVTGDNAELTTSMLSVMGVTNAEAIVQEALADNIERVAIEKWFAEDASVNLANATAKDINELIEEGKQAGLAEGALVKYVAEKIVANSTALTTDGDIENLKVLARQVGVTADAFSKLKNGNPGEKLTPEEEEAYWKNVIDNAVDANYGKGNIQNDPGYGGGYKPNKDSNSGSKNKTATVFDAAAESVKNLKTELDNLNTTLDNTDPYSQKLPILQQLIGKQAEYNTALQKQSETYEAEYQNRLAVLPEEWRNRVVGNDFFGIDTIPDNLKDAVSKANDFKDKWTSVNQQILTANKELEKLNHKQMELAQTRLDDKIGVVQNKISDIQNQMDEAESMGLIATENHYKALLRLSRQEEKYNQNKLAGFQAELILIGENADTDAYYDCLDNIQKCENAISECARDQANWNKSMLELPIEYLEKANDELNDQMDELQDLQDDYDSAISGVTTHLQEQIDAQQELRDAAEKASQEKIDAVQDEIDVLQKANDERKTQLDLEEKKYNLERAKSQRANRVFRESEGGFTYEADQEAIRTAQNEYDDVLFDNHISDLEHTIKGIEDARDELLESYDNEIDRLQDILDSWDNITNAIQRAKDLAMADTILGSGWQDRVPSGDTGDIENITGKYEKNDREQTWIQQQIDDNDRLIQKVQEYVNAWQMGEISIREAREEINDIVGDIAPEMEANDERVSSISTYKSAWTNAAIDIPQNVAIAAAAIANNADELIATEQRQLAAQAYADQWAASALSVGGSLGSITESGAEATLAEGEYLSTRIVNLSTFTSAYEQLSNNISSMCRGIVDACKEAERAMRDLADAEDDFGYARGTKNARPGLHPVAEGNNPEIIIRGNGSAIVAHKATHYPFAGGETVLAPAETRRVLSGDGLQNLDPDRMLFSEAQVQAFSKMAAQPSLPNLSPTLKQISSNVSANTRQGDVNVTFGNINLPQVKDVDTFAKAITDGTLESALQQRLMKNK